MQPHYARTDYHCEDNRPYRPFCIFPCCRTSRTATGALPGRESWALFRLTLLSPARSILVPQILASICLLPSHHPSSVFFIHTTTSSWILLKLAAMNSTAQKTHVLTYKVKKSWKARENDVYIPILVEPILIQTKPLLDNLILVFKPKFRVPY